MKAPSDGFKKYVQDEIIDLQDMIFPCKMDFLTLGITVTSYSESANALIKQVLPEKNQTLLQMKKRSMWYFEQRDESVYYKERHKTITHFPIEELFGISGPEKSVKMLQASYEKALKLNIVEIERSNEFFIHYVNPEYSRKQQKIKNTIIDIASKRCNCNKAKRVGVPCSHYI